MTLALFRAGRSLAPALFLAPAFLCFTMSRAFAAPVSPFTLVSTRPVTLTPASLAAAQKTTKKTARRIIVTGPDNDMLSYRLGRVRSPTLSVTESATLTILFVNTDDDMAHNLRFGAAPKGAYPSDMAAYVKASAGTPELPHRAETVLHGDEITVKAPDKPGAYAYFCTVRGHAAGGMAGTILVRRTGGKL